jgi:hypothetical protein
MLLDERRLLGEHGINGCREPVEVRLSRGDDALQRVRCRLRTLALAARELPVS